MKCAKPLLKRNPQFVFLALVTVITVLIAPVCAPLCASKICASHSPSNASETRCHHPETDENSSGVSAENAKLCTGAELPAATLNATKRSQIVQSRREMTAAKVAALDAKQLFDFTRESGTGQQTLAVLTRQAKTSSTTTVLRI
jgi:hypothetical protein